MVNSIDVLVGLTMASVTGEEGGHEMVFTTKEGRRFQFYHQQNCCEHVYIADVIGDLPDLVGSPILIAEEVSSESANEMREPEESFTWTFYRFATVRGTVTVRWYGSSNGYYSEDVSFEEIV